MAKELADAVFDAALAKVATCVTQTLCSSQPANFAGIAAVKLGSYTLTAGLGNGDYTAANGLTSGRRVTIGAQTGNNATASGNGTWIVYDDGVTLLAATSCPSKTVTISEPFDVSAHDLELLDPT